MSKNSRLVYSTEVGRIKEAKNQPEIQETYGIVRIQRESKGRGGKMVSVVQGIPAQQLKDISKRLKSLCATGGSIKAGQIEIQGDHREKIRAELEAQGFKVKFSGG